MFDVCRPLTQRCHRDACAILGSEVVLKRSSPSHAASSSRCMCYTWLRSRIETFVILSRSVVIEMHVLYLAQKCYWDVRRPLMQRRHRDACAILGSEVLLGRSSSSHAASSSRCMCYTWLRSAIEMSVALSRSVVIEMHVLYLAQKSY